MTILTVGLAIALFAPPAAQSSRAESATPGDTQALTLLLGLVNEPMNTPGCRKNRLDGRPYLFKEDLADNLSAFSKGTNRVTGQCQGRECSVLISHRNGEDVFSALYRFKLTAKGTVIRSSIECIWTP